MTNCFRKLGIGVSVVALVVLVLSGAALANNALKPPAQATVVLESNAIGAPAGNRGVVTHRVAAFEGSILVYTDDYVQAAGATYVEQALNALGLSYTSYYSDPAGFGAALTAGGPWDLVIVSHNNYFALGDWWSEIEAYFNSGGMVIITTFDIDGSDSEATTLWSTLGLSYVSGMGIPENVYRWDPTHPIFTDPEAVPDLTAWVEGYGDNGDHVAPSAGVAAVGGFSVSYSANDSGIIVRDDGRAIVNSFLVCEARGDADSDGQVDAVELWTDEIEYITEGGVPPEREVLMYQDDAYGNYFAQDALDALGYNYTVFTENFPGFETALTTGSWDLVILNDCNYTPPDTTLDALEAYINAGGKAILVSWRLDIAHSLWATAGLTGAVPYGAPGTNVYRWEPAHPIFTTPDAVSDFTWWNPGIVYGTWGYTFTPTDGSALAGTDPTPPGVGIGLNAVDGRDIGGALEDTSIMVRSDNRVIVNGFLVSTTDASNGISLWKDEITFLIGGETPTCNVLIYDDNTIDQKALQAAGNLGLSYTRATSADFVTLLTGGGWDVVVFDCPSNTPVDGDWQTALMNYIAGGGKLIMSYWDLDFESAPFQSALGVSVAMDIFAPLPLYQWTAHEIFDGVPDMTTGLDDYWGDNGDRLNTVGDGVSVGGYTASPTASQSAVVIANGERTIYHGLLFDDFDGDQDIDGKLDIIELIENEILFLCGEAECVEDDSGQLDIVGKSGGPGTTMTVPVRIQGAPNVVESLGFEVIYNTGILDYVGYTRGDCVTGFDFFDVSEPEPGRLIVGGFEAGLDTIPAGANCIVVNLVFTALTCEQGSVDPLAELQGLVDDLAGWTTSGACFQCGCSCDVNGDGEVTPVDALCAFQKYLGICPTACGPCEDICCDVTMDGDCTPADALEIFKEYLGLPSICSE